jgi:hypothetical protein
MTEEERQRISVPLDEWAMNIAKEAAREVIKEHLELCEARKDLPILNKEVKECKKDIQQVKLRLATLIAFMAGSGLLGGAAGGLVASAIFGC